VRSGDAADAFELDVLYRIESAGRGRAPPQISNNSRIMRNLTRNVYRTREDRL
jgi:hypothetical protein